MRKSAYFYNRDGLRIQPDEFKAKMLDPVYRTVRQFENDSVRCEVVWTGMGDDPNNSLPDLWKLFEMQVWNKNSFGSWVLDPVDGSRTFPTEKQAIAAYESFLVRWGGCEVDDEGEFIEIGNEAEPVVIEPPAPPPPDQPLSKLDSILDSEGAW